MSADPRIDAAIAAAAPFAQPILATLRAAVHEACPEVEETIKWGRPFFLLHGRPFAMMAAFKAHAIFGFWRGQGIARGDGKGDEAGGQYGRLTCPDDLPGHAVLIAEIRAAAATSGTPTPPRSKVAKAPIALPGDFAEALSAHAGARVGYDALTPGGRREYLEWIVGAKRAETRTARIAKAAAQIAEGKTLNWKYQRG